MGIRKEKGKPLEPVIIKKIWVEIPTEEGSHSYLVSEEVANYIEDLETKLKLD